MWLWILIGLNIISEVHGNSDGVFKDPCDSILPEHRNGQGVLHAPQSSTPPFELSCDEPKNEGDPITVVLRSLNATQFKGFMVEARETSGSLVGKFILIDISMTRLLFCNGLADSAVINSNNQRKSLVKVNWMAPGAGVDITFRATFLEDFKTFWEPVETKGCQTTTPTPSTQPSITTSTELSTTISTELSTTISTELSTTISTELSTTISTVLSTTISPELSTTISPELSTTICPELSTTISTELSTTISPELSTTISPELSTTISPELSTTISPELSTTISTELSTTISTVLSTTISPELSTTISPELSTTISPELSTTICTELSTTICTELSTTISTELSTTISTTQSNTAEASMTTQQEAVTFNLLEGAGIVAIIVDSFLVVLKMALSTIFITALHNSPFSRCPNKWSQISCSLLCAALEISAVVLLCVAEPIKVTLVALVCVAIVINFIELVIACLPIGPSHELKEICDHAAKVCSVIHQIFTIAVIFVGVSDNCRKNWLLRVMIAFTLFILLYAIWLFVSSPQKKAILGRSKLGSLRNSERGKQQGKVKKLSRAEVMVTAVSVIFTFGSLCFSVAVAVGIFGCQQE